MPLTLRPLRALGRDALKGRNLQRTCLGRHPLLGAFLTVATLFLLAEAVWPQQTIYNVPSPDVLEAGKVYLETDQYFRPWKTESGRDAFSFARGVVGIGHNVELGINTGPFEYLHRNNPFIDLAAKWRPFLLEFGDKEKPGAFGLYGGNHAGIGLGGDVAGDLRNFTYGAFTLKLPVLETRVGVGPYFATRQVFGVHSRGGLLATFEQPIPGIDGLLLAADWFSGRGGYATPGLIYTRGPFTFYLGYGFANTGRRDDLVTFEVGFTLR
jgi:hypothetical protein